MAERQTTQRVAHNSLLLPVLAYLISAASLYSIFITTMLNYNDGIIDWEYLAYASLRILVISVVPAVVAYLAKARRWYSAAIIGVVCGVAAAVAYVKLSI